MKKPIVCDGLNPQCISILYVAPVERCHSHLENLLDLSRLALYTTSSSGSALYHLRRHEFPVVVCECDLQPGSWRDLLLGFRELRYPPSLVVTSRVADDYLWAEALNLGAYDVLAQPFDSVEVARVLHSAYRYWTRRRDNASYPVPPSGQSLRLLATGSGD